MNVGATLFVGAEILAVIFLAVGYMHEDWFVEREEMFWKKIKNLPARAQKVLNSVFTKL